METASIRKFSPARVFLALALFISCLAFGTGGPARNWEIFLIHHTHVDIGYTDSQENCLHRQWQNLEQAMDLVDATADLPDDARFRWNPEVTWAIESWLEQASPDQRERFIRQAVAGSIGLDALYGNMLTGLCRPDELRRALGFAGELESITGVDIKSAMITDVPGWSWGLAPALSQAGVRYLSLGPNRGHRIGSTLSVWGDRAFYWEGPSGKDRVLCFVHGKGYSWFHTPTALYGDVPLPNKFTKDRIFRYLQKLEREGYPYDILPIRYAIGSDNGPPDPNISAVVEEWNRRYPEIRVRLSTAAEALSELERRHGDIIPVYSGDLTPYWEDGAASTARETAFTREASERLAQASALFALADPTAFPADAFGRAYKDVLLFNEHTWGAHNSITSPDSEFAKTQWSWKERRAQDARDQAADLLALSTASFMGEGGPGALVVNTHSWPITAPVVVKGAEGVKGVTMDDGTPVASQTAADGSLIFVASEVPPFSSVRYGLGPEPFKGGGGCLATVDALSNEKYSVRLDPATGAILSIRDKQSGAEFVNHRHRHQFNQLVYVGARMPLLGALLPDRMSKPEIEVVEFGPARCSVRIQSHAPKAGALATTISIYAGLDRIEIENRLDRPQVRGPEGMHFAFPALVDDPRVRFDVAWGEVEVDRDQLDGSCKNYLTPLRWVDVSGGGKGIQIVLIDAPLVEVGDITTDATRYGWIDYTRQNGVIYSYVMNNYWETNYKADQPGVTSFRYVLHPHGEYDYSQNYRRAAAAMQPLLAALGGNGLDAGGPETGNPLVIVESLEPVGDGIEVRLFNASNGRQAARLSWPGRVCRGKDGTEQWNGKEMVLAGFESVAFICR